MFSAKSELPQKVNNTLQIKQDDKFFCRLLSKESSMSHPSFRAAVAVPFVWESQPGTPKYTFCEESLPPLTPPPSYYFNSNKKPVKKSASRSNLLLALFPKMNLKKTTLSPSSSSSFSSMSSSMSSSDSSKSGRSFMRSGLSTDFRGDDDEEEDGGASSPTSTLCFGISCSTSSKVVNGGCRR